MSGKPTVLLEPLDWFASILRVCEWQWIVSPVWRRERGLLFSAFVFCEGASMHR